ncbi:MAG: hypothetical protein AAB116_23455 [Candidatus Poribacteria bacterium]
MSVISSFTIFCYLVSVCMALISFWLFKSRREKTGLWLVATGGLILLTVVILNLSSFFYSGNFFREWLVKWVAVGGDELGVMKLGFYQGPLAIMMAILPLAFLGAASIESSSFKKYIPVCLISYVGVLLAWGSITPWLAFFGFVMTILGGTLSYVFDWKNDKDAKSVSRLGWQLVSVLFLVWLSVTVLIQNHAPGMVNIWMQDEAVHDAFAMGYKITAGLFFVIAALLQFYGFPFSGYLLSTTGTEGIIKVLLRQIFPAWVMFAFLSHLGHNFRISSQALLSVGLVPLFSSLLTAVVGIFQSNEKRAAVFWISSGFNLALAVSLFCGDRYGFSLMLSVSLVSFMVALAPRDAMLILNKWKKLFINALSVFSAAIGCGVLGTVGSISYVKIISRAYMQPALLVFILLAVFCVMLLMWKLCWRLIRVKLTGYSWHRLVVVSVILCLSLDVLWNGITAESSLFSLFFSQIPPQEVEIGFTRAVWICLVSQIFCCGISYWLFCGRWDPYLYIQAKCPRLTEATSSGWYIESIFIRLAMETGSAILFVDKIKEMFISRVRLIKRVLGCAASVVSKVDTRILNGLNKSMFRWISVPAKLLQLVQSGDVQWYVMLVVCSGLAIVVHFLRV